MTTSITRAGTTATVTTATPHGFATGDTVTIAGATPAGYNGAKTITVTTATHVHLHGGQHPHHPGHGHDHRHVARSREQLHVPGQRHPELHAQVGQRGDARSTACSPPARPTGP